MSTRNMETNPRGIPKAPFVEDVDEYMKGGEGFEATLRKFTEATSKYKFMEANLLQRRKSLDSKIPELEKTLEVIKFMMEKNRSNDGDNEEAIEAMYELNDTLFAKAKLARTEKVCLWLGANVMLEYSIDEALVLLQSKLESANKSLKNANDDLEFLRDQITTMEVNTARVYNWDVKRRRAEKSKVQAVAA